MVHFTGNQGAIFIQPEGIGTQVTFLGCHEVESVQETLGDYTPSFCRDVDLGYREVATIESTPEAISASIVESVTNALSVFERQKCPFALYINMVCSGRKDVFSNAQKTFIVNVNRVTNRTFENLSLIEGDDRTRAVYTLQGKPPLYIIVNVDYTQQKLPIPSALTKSAFAMTVDGGLYYAADAYLYESIQPDWQLVSNTIAGVRSCAYNELDPVSCQLIHNGSVAYLRRSTGNFASVLTQLQMTALTGIAVHTINAVAINPITERLYVAVSTSIGSAFQGAFYSDDYGLTWNVYTAYGGALNRGVFDVVIDDTGSNLYMTGASGVTSTTFVYTSLDAGNTLGYSTSLGINTGYSTLIAIEPGDETIVFTGKTNNLDLTKSIDSAASFNDCDDALLGSPAYSPGNAALWIARDNPSYVYSARGFSLFWSTDKWVANRNTKLLSIQPVSIHGTVQDSNAYLLMGIASSPEVYWTIDNGTTLIDKSVNIPASVNGITRKGLITF